jgi:hypothetical protein
MTPQHFQRQMTRLSETFGKQAYGQERVQLLWREVGQLSDEWMTSVTDDFIGGCRQAPLLAEFRERAAIERERLWQIEKRQHTRECEAAMASVFAREEIKSICESIRKIARGGMTDDDRCAFLKSLNGATGIE